MTDSELIDQAGGTSEVAKLCEVSPPAVSQWRTDGIPKAQRKFLALARPDIDWMQRPEIQTKEAA
jgi:DNA-binding transcriptional regulator YdaS (Cro superfamily)